MPRASPIPRRNSPISRAFRARRAGKRFCVRARSCIPIAMTTNENWVTVAKLSDLAPGEVKGVEHGDKQIALYNVEGKICATDSICTHAFAMLSDGWLDGDVIECPLHAGRFEVCTGKAVGP